MYPIHAGTSEGIGPVENCRAGACSTLPSARKGASSPNSTRISSFGQAAKKLLFMGVELGQRTEWNHESSLDWHLLEHESHLGLQKWVRDLNHLYRGEPARHELDCEPGGFEWVDCADWEGSAISFLRRGKTSSSDILAVFNFTPRSV